MGRAWARAVDLEIDEQVAFQLVVVDLLSEARQFEEQVTEEHEQLEATSDELEPEQASRLLVVTDVLNQVKNADIIYPQPMLTDQVSYLYNMVSKADQAPGIEPPRSIPYGPYGGRTRRSRVPRAGCRRWPARYPDDSRGLAAR